MKANEATIFIFIASIIIGILISSNMNFGEINNKVLLTPLEYQEAYNYSNRLNKDINNLKDKHNEYSKKLQNYKNNKYDKDKVFSEMQKEIEVNEMLLGNIDIEGEGIVIDLNDANSEFQNYVINYDELRPKIIHDKDLVRVVNELRCAGAEAISINGQRVTYKSSILCWGVFIEIDGVKIPEPFNIKAIGDKEKLYSYMAAEGGYLSTLTFRGIKVDMEKYDKVQVMSNYKNFDYNYMRQMKEN